MKKILVALLVLLMMFGCSSKKEETINNKPKEEEKKEDDKEEKDEPVVDYYVDEEWSEGLTSLELFQYDVDGNGNLVEQSLGKISDPKEMGEVLEHFQNRKEITPEGIGGVALPYLKLNYKDESKMLVFYGTNLFDVDGTLYEVDTTEDLFATLKSIFEK